MTRFLFPALGGLLYGYDIGATSSATISIQVLLLLTMSSPSLYFSRIRFCFIIVYTRKINMVSEHSFLCCLLPETLRLYGYLIRCYNMEDLPIYQGPCTAIDDHVNG